MGWWDTTKRIGAAAATGGFSELAREDPFGIDNPLGNRADNEFRDVDPFGNVEGQARRAGAFADQNISNSRESRAGMMSAADLMRRRAMGEDSLSAEQLRQGLQQNLAAQQSMAAGARGGNQAMAARNAMMNAGRMGAGMSGQAAMAGIQERQAALSGLGGLYGQIRGQDLQAALGSRGQALQGYGDIEAQRTARFNALTQVPTQQEQILGAVSGALGMYAKSKGK